ncbi:hypothetical protein [Alkaliphilus serpentinus]|uniref:Uncharacterized protein n=1 Tax=Alkaliphilus serpentinus TaxID=1482731 RepID=A0A833HNB9_9FIRM|nr:hypothetical protein [Alkaliphilus serpentinus]KAB3529409.1 hypothetical protein F8153_09250 [Alkaliphilus serpentinus]
MRLKSIIILMIILVFSLSLTSCQTNDSARSNEDKTVKLDFFISPEQIIAMDETLSKEMLELGDRARTADEEMKEKYGNEKITDMNIIDSEVDGNEIINEYMKILDKGRIIEDINTIEDTFNQLRKIKGKIVEVSELDMDRIVATFYLNDDKETPYLDNTHEDYIRVFYLLEDNIEVITKMTKSTIGETELNHIKAKISNELASTLRGLSQSHN